MYDRKYSGVVVVSCSGQDEPEIRTTPYGEMRSRSGASLRFTSADADLVWRHWSKGINVPEEACVTIREPSVDEFFSLLSQVSRSLGKYPQGETGIDLYYCGHGRPGDGAILLKDGTVTPSELILHLKTDLEPKMGARGLSMLLDSCYSAAFLFEMIALLQYEGELRLYDALCSSMHDEKSWELTFLGHGAFTYTHFHKGNKHVDRDELATAIDLQDQKTIARCIQGLVALSANPTTYLTQGMQHPLDCIKGGFMSAGTRGECDVPDLGEDFTVHDIIKAFEASQRRRC